MPIYHVLQTEYYNDNVGHVNTHDRGSAPMGPEAQAGVCAAYSFASITVFVISVGSTPGDWI